MTKNPFINAAAAEAYIVLIVLFMNNAQRFAPKEDGIIAPITFLSLFTLSAAVMGYLFVMQPLRLYLDGQKKEAVDLFSKTVGTFACITIVIVAILFFRPGA